MKLRPGSRVRHKTTTGEVEAIFLRMCDPDDFAEVSLRGGGKRRADRAWVQLEDGTLDQAVYYRLRPA
jgi:hypothetical protein